MDTPARPAQARRLATLVSASSEPTDLVVVCGDLNLLPGSETFSILGAIGLVDPVGEADTRTSRYTNRMRSANYLLIPDPSAVETFDVVKQPEVSDHRALQLDV